MKRSHLSDRCDGAVLPAACLQQEPSKVETNAAAVLLFNSIEFVHHSALLNRKVAQHVSGRQASET